MDYNIFLAINGLADKSPFLDALGVFFGVYLIYLFGAFLIVLAVTKRDKIQTALAFASCLISRGIIVESIKRLVNRPRPYEILQAKLLVVDDARGLSFSSGHAVILFAVAFSFYGTKWFWPLLFLAALGSIARIYIGVHYPSDIVESVIIAGVVVLILRPLFYNKSKHKKTK